MFIKKPKKNTQIYFITGSLVITSFAVTMIAAVIMVYTLGNIINLKYLSNTIIVYAQMNSKQGSSSTLLGDVNIPYSSSNDTKTTVVNNATNSTISTAIDKTAIAQNVTDAVNFAKETPTTPISPTGISTQGLHQPPGHRILNNSNIPVGK
jgi:microcystin-dependent protein